MYKNKGVSTVAIIMLIGVAMIAVGLIWFIISSLVLKQQEKGNEDLAGTSQS